MKKYGVKELKEGAEQIAGKYGIKSEDAKKILSHYSMAGKWDEVGEALALNNDTIKRAADAIKINLPKLAGIPSKDPEVKGPEVLQAPNIDRVAGEIVEKLNRGELPADISETVESLLEEFKTRYNIEDLTKISGQQWRAACLFVGAFIKQSGLLHDKEREKHNGGAVYDVGRVSGLVDLWEYATTLYKHTPLRFDFFAFCGIGKSWFYESMADGVSPQRAEIVKKVIDVEEAALCSGIADARENPAGKIYLTKVHHGYKEDARQIDININTGSYEAKLPFFTE